MIHMYLHWDIAGPVCVLTENVQCNKKLPVCVCVCRVTLSIVDKLKQVLITCKASL